jgi:hypothetical protein
MCDSRFCSTSVSLTGDKQFSSSPFVTSVCRRLVLNLA